LWCVTERFRDGAFCESKRVFYVEYSYQNGNVYLKGNWSDLMEIKYELVSSFGGVQLLTLGGKATGYRIEHNRTLDSFQVSGGGKTRFTRRRSQATKLVVKMFEKAVRGN
jgi:hypothetical protein